MPKLRRLTIVTLDPERLARFYKQVFEMRRVPNPKGEAIYLSGSSSRRVRQAVRRFPSGEYHHRTD
jgi:hypothetical protein